MRSKRLILFVAFIAILCPLLFSATPEIIKSDSRIYEEMETLYISSSYGVPSSSRPWSIGEAEEILKRINYNTLNEDEKALYDSISRSLQKEGKGDGVLEYNGHLGINLEVYGHTNSDFSNEKDWIIGYDERLPMIEAGITFTLLDTFNFYSEVSVGRGKYDGKDEERLLDIFSLCPNGIGAVIPSADKRNGTSSNTLLSSSMYASSFTSNILTSIPDFDSVFPKRAYVSVGGKYWNLQFGRDRISWGNSNIGNLIIDDHVDYHDLMRLVLYSDSFKCEFTYLFLEYDWSSSQTIDKGFKAFLAHRFEFRLSQRLTLAFSENVMYVTPDIIEAKYFNPAFLFHNLDNHSIFNAIAHIELDYQFAKGFNLYSQFALDQATAPGEGSDQASAFGVLGGLEYKKVLYGGDRLSSFMEVAYTTPLMYRRDKVDFLIIDKNKLSTSGGYVIDVDFLGFPYGNDSFVMEMGNEYTLSSGVGVSMKIREILKGSLDIYTSHNKDGNNEKYPNIDGGFLYGDITSIFSVTLESYCPLSFFFDSFFEGKLSSNLSYIRNGLINKEKKNDLQFTLSLSLSI